MVLQAGDRGFAGYEEEAMTREERLVISAYTGHLMVSEENFILYVSRLLERKIYRHDLIHGKVWKEIRTKVEPEYMKLCEVKYK